MALKSNFDSGRVERETQTQADSLYEKIIESFIRAGEKFIINARGQMQDHAMGQYKDQTKNLRSSIGYLIFHNGESVFKNMDGKNTNFIGEAGQGESQIQDLIQPKGIQLIGIAGMNYASFVESKGYNVISYQADVCMVDLAVYLETLGVIKWGSGAKLEESFIP
jgi:hypothetical protein